MTHSSTNMSNASFVAKLFMLSAFLGVIASINPGDSHAQTNVPPGTVGLGGQIGSPSGITLKWYDAPGRAFDLLGAWDLDDFFFLNLHMLFERPLPESPLNFYYGPGAFLGVQDGRRRNSDMVLGISGNFGLNFFTERFEVFLQLTPRLNVVPDTRGHFGGGVGLRYYF
jgi:hypothetical protein